MSETNVFSYFKQNVGEEDIIKLFLLSALKALISVGIVIAALLSATKLIEWYGIGTTILFIIATSIFSLWSCMHEFNANKRNQFNFFDYKTWKFAFTNLLSANKLFYFDAVELDKEMTISYAYYVVALFITWLLLIIVSITGILSWEILNVIINLITRLRISLIFPPESVLFTLTTASSIIIMSALFIKLKWKRIWLNGFNWNITAWCICAAIIITTISFVTGVAIRRIAGYIGIEYTAILVSMYVLITAIYVYLDLKQWIANKERENLSTIPK